jgi:3'-phosphoadenosine 5'-phosphosulfate (PAPS) 3'-phosphatase
MYNRLTIQNPEIRARYEFMMDTVYAFGDKALDMINTGDVEVFIKPDQTKVTTVDKKLNRLFIERVEDRNKSDIVWGEEEINEERKIELINNRWLWLIDPIDGTSGFWRSYQNKRFKENTSTIMITGFAPGETTPTMSVIHNPFQDQKVTISAVGGFSFYQTENALMPKMLLLDRANAPIRLQDVRRYEQTDWRDATPELSNFRQIVPYARSVDHQLFMGSVALGDVDVSLFPGPSNAHDVAPGALILHNAGGYVRTFGKEKYNYHEVDWRKNDIEGTVGTVHPILGYNVVKKVLEQNALAAEVTPRAA